MEIILPLSEVVCLADSEIIASNPWCNKCKTVAFLICGVTRVQNFPNTLDLDSFIDTHTHLQN